MPAISILLPVRNAAATLGETLESLKAQTLTDFQLVLVDDHSSDASMAVAREIFADDLRLELIVPEAQGLVPALRAGARACRAPFIARMDGDDVAFPRRLELQYRLFEKHPQLAIVGCGVESFADEQPLGEGYRRYDQWLNGLLEHDAMMRELYVESPLSHPTVMMRREALEAVGGYQDHLWPEDYDLWLRMAQRGYQFGKVDEILLRWRDTPGRTSRQDSRYSPEAFMRCKVHYLCQGPLKEEREVIIWGAGQMGGKFGRLLEEQGKRVVSFVDIDPKKIGNRRLHGWVISPEELPPPRQYKVLACVGSRGARDLIRTELSARGYAEGTTFWCVL